jgi:glycosyltransferase involved in cell wall biosynthesis
MQRRFPRVWRLIVPESATMLARLIEKLKPDCIHSLGMQFSSYYLYEAREILGGALPAPWIYSSWGSDYFHYWQFSEHQDRIRQVLSSCDYLVCDCERDIRLAKEYGFTGRPLGVFPGGGGYPLKEMMSMRQSGPVSKRRAIAIKGLQHDRGRALLALKAITESANLLQGYEIFVYQAHPIVREEVGRMAESLDLRIKIYGGSYRDMWRLFGRTHLSIGVSISDGTPNTMLESMAMGAFPIQTDPGGATSESIKDGANGLIVQPHDADGIARAIRRALRNDQMVETAAEINSRLTSERISADLIQPRVIDLYEAVLARGKGVRSKAHNGLVGRG